MDFRYLKPFHLFVTDYISDQTIHQDLSFLNMMIDIDILLVSYIVRCTGRSQRQERGSGLFALVMNLSYIFKVVSTGDLFTFVFHFFCINMLFCQCFSHFSLFSFFPLTEKETFINSHVSFIYRVSDQIVVR